MYVFSSSGHDRIGGNVSVYGVQRKLFNGQLSSKFNEICMYMCFKAVLLL